MALPNADITITFTNVSQAKGNEIYQMLWQLWTEGNLTIALTHAPAIEEIPNGE
jgi:hypothetical protein